MAVSSVPPKRARKLRPDTLIWPPLNIAHPGAAGEASEDTLAPFELALRMGAEGITLDVHLSSEGVPVVICDARLSNTASGSGQVQKHPAITRLQLDAGAQVNRRIPSRAGRQHTRSPIPLLSEVLKWVRDQRCMVFLAINNSTPGAGSKVLKEINRAKARDFTRVIAHSFPELRRLRRLDAKVRLGLRFVDRSPAIHDAKALGAEVLLPHWTATSPSFIRDAHHASMLVIPWTVNRPRQMHRTILEGADGIITNYPARLTAVLARLQKSRRTMAS